ncbi:MAG: carboxypeptidase regulatory-like domain-containing protein [Pirellula sp.]
MEYENFRIAFRCQVTAIALFGLTYVSGCGGPQFGNVSGQVTMDGQPLPDVAVRFEDEGGSATIARTDKSGNYVMRYTIDQIGAPVGKHKVTIITPAPVTEGTGERYKELLPPEYNRKSTLTADVKPGKQTIDWKLKSKP